MDLLTQADFRRLVERTEGPCVSIFLPTHRAGEQTRQGPIRFKNLLRQAEELLIANGLRGPEARALLEPAAGLQADSLFWQHQSDGLAVFLSAGQLQYYRVPLTFEELVVVGERHHLKPLFPLLSGDGRFYVLALSQNQLRLLEGSRNHVAPVELSGLPQSLSEALQLDDPQKHLQFHTRAPARGGEQSAMFHGHGAGQEQDKDRIQRYFRQVSGGLRDFLQDRRAPLILAGVEYYFSLFREVSDYPHLLPEGVPGNPESLSDEELHRRAWPLVEPHFQAAEGAALERLQAALAAGQASVTLDEALPAVYAGRVETLLVARGARRWGRFDPATGRVDLRREPTAGDEELLDAATVRAFLTGSTIFVVAPERLPEGVALAAIYRY